MKDIKEYINEERFDKPNLKKDFAAPTAFLLLMSGKSLKEILPELRPVIKETIVGMYDEYKDLFNKVDESLLDLIR